MEDYILDRKYEPDNFENLVRENFNFRLCFFLKDKQEIHCYCPTQRMDFWMDLKKGETVKTIKCPHEKGCQQSDCRFKNYVYKHSGLKEYRDVAYFQPTDRGMVLRAFRCEFDFSGEPYEELYRDGSMQKHEFLRVYYNYDRTTEAFSNMKMNYSPYGGSNPIISWTWRKCKQYRSYFAFEFLVNPIEQLKGTFMEGYGKYIALYNKAYEPNFNSYDYDRLGAHYYTAALLIAIFRAPILRQLMSHDLDRVAYDYICSVADTGTGYGKIINYRAKNLLSALKFDISKLSAFNADDKSELTHADIYSCQKLIKYGIKLTREKLEIASANNFWKAFELLPEAQLNDVLKYLSGQKDLGSCPEDYYDYINECKKLNYNLKRVAVIFPKTLATAHSTTSELLRNMTDETKQAAFFKAATKCASFRFRQGKMSLHVIDSIKDLKNWAGKFGNCSGGYVERIIDGTSVIFIICDVKKKKQPYFMLEYSPKLKKIIQCRGEKNSRETPEIKNFTEQWMTFVKAKISKKSSKASLKQARVTS